MTWEFIPSKKRMPKFRNPILIEGLPGMGNVGKVALDFMIDELKAKKIYDIFSYDLPNSVFVNENNLIELPVIELYHKRLKNGKDLLFLTGDVQPTAESSCYSFTEAILDRFEELDGSKIITLGGIGLAHIPAKPQLYCAGNDAIEVEKFLKGTKMSKELFGIVGPIIGVSGLLLGLGGRRGIPAITILAETLGHPAYLGVNGAREMIAVLDKKLSLKMNLKRLDKEISELETEMNQMMEQSTTNVSPKLKKLRSMVKETSYIG